MFEHIILTIDRFFDNLPSRRYKHRKESMRAVLTQKRRVLTADDVERCSADVLEQIIAHPAFVRAQRIMLYYPIHNEIDLRSLLTLAPEKTYFLPVTHRHSLEVREYKGAENMKRGKYKIPEPQGPAYRGKLDLILVPGVAFDKKGNRMGRGGGYYDAFLRRRWFSTKIGVGYHFQQVKEVPHNWRDVRLDDVIFSH